MSKQFQRRNKILKNSVTYERHNLGQNNEPRETLFEDKSERSFRKREFTHWYKIAKSHPRKKSLGKYEVFSLAFRLKLSKSVLCFPNPLASHLKRFFLFII